ncbi:MAG TPA: alpha/beta hydrolase [Opitutaceae bacterium]|jgi:acetyl esterase/lipase
MNLRFFSLPLGLLFGFPVVAETPAPTAKVIELWSGAPPGLMTAVGAEVDFPVKKGAVLPHQIKNVSHPTLTLFSPAPAKANGVAVVVAPGGGFRELESDKEGEKAAVWLNQLGITALVLKYRIPADPARPEFSVALPDAQRAIRLIRSQATALSIRADRVGFLGFSAGAQLGVALATHFADAAYRAVDPADQLSARPDFEIVIYPGGLLTKGTENLSPNFPVTADTPQMFIVDAETDRVDSENCTALFVALKRAKVPAELHIYSLGAHGFALTPSVEPHSGWPARCAEWMAGQGILP